MAAEYQIDELADLTGVTPRTIRFYIQQGLLPSPGMGPSARYTDMHLMRLRAIRKLQSQHRPLTEIGRHLDQLDDASLAKLVSTDEPTDSALDYARWAQASTAQAGTGLHSAATSSVSAPAAVTGVSVPTKRARFQWERIVVTPDLEIHVRRPLDHEKNRRLERLLELADRLFEER